MNDMSGGKQCLEKAKTEIEKSTKMEHKKKETYKSLLSYSLKAFLDSKSVHAHSNDFVVAC